MPHSHKALSPPRLIAIKAPFTSFTHQQKREIISLLRPVKNHKATSTFDPVKETIRAIRFFFAYRHRKDFPLSKIRAEIKAFAEHLFNTAAIISHLDEETLRVLGLDLSWQDSKAEELYWLSWKAQMRLNELHKTGRKSQTAEIIFLANLAQIYEDATGRLAGTGTTGPFFRFINFTLRIVNPNQLKMITPEGLRTAIRKAVDYHRCRHRESQKSELKKNTFPPIPKSPRKEWKIGDLRKFVTGLCVLTENGWKPSNLK